MNVSWSSIPNGFVASPKRSWMRCCASTCCRGKRIAPNSPYIFPANPR